MQLRLTSVRVALALVLVVSAAGFAAAANHERSVEAAASRISSAPEGSPAREAAERAASRAATTTVPRPNSTAVTPPTTSGLQAPEGSPAREAAEHGSQVVPLITTTSAAEVSTPPTGAAPAGHTSTLVGETLFGFHTESAATTAAVVVVLLLAALAALSRQPRWPLLLAAALVAVLALLDVREAVHQHNEARSGLVAAAAALAAAHLLASGLAVIAFRQHE